MPGQDPVAARRERTDKSLIVDIPPPGVPILPIHLGTYNTTQWNGTVSSAFALVSPPTACNTILETLQLCRICGVYNLNATDWNIQQR
jgi:hypothetical protein